MEKMNITAEKSDNIDSYLILGLILIQIPTSEHIFQDSLATIGLVLILRATYEIIKKIIKTKRGQ